MSVYIREKETGLIGMLIQLCLTMSHDKQSSCVIKGHKLFLLCLQDDAVIAKFIVLLLCG